MPILGKQVRSWHYVLLQFHAARLNEPGHAGSQGGNSTKQALMFKKLDQMLGVIESQLQQQQQQQQQQQAGQGQQPVGSLQAEHSQGKDSPPPCRDHSSERNAHSQSQTRSGAWEAQIENSISDLQASTISIQGKLDKLLGLMQHQQTGSQGGVSTKVEQ
jgi:hypothetical protein